MGQYWIVANLDKEQFLDPHHCGDWAKLQEFASTGGGMLACLAVLLADGNGKGGGDIGEYNSATSQYDHADDPIIGSWAGDRIVVVGDYAEPGKWGIPTATEEKPRRNLYNHAYDAYTDFSAYAVRALCRVPDFRERFEKKFEWREGGLAGVLAEAEKPLRRKRRAKAA